MAPTFPPSLRFSTEGWRIENAGRSGGQTIIGGEQIVAGPGARWRAKLSLIILDDTDYIDARGFIDSLDGQTNSFMVGPVSWRGQPWFIDPLTGSVITPDKMAASLAESAAYEMNPDTAGVLAFALAADVAVNATTIMVARTHGGFLRPGQRFQIGSRMHQIVALTAPDAPDSAGNAQQGVNVAVVIRPWTRSAYGAGTPLNFATPQTVMRLVDDQQGLIEESGGSPLADLSLELVEAF